MTHPPAVYGLWSDELGKWRRTMNCALLYATTDEAANRLAKKYPGYRVVRLVPEGSGPAWRERPTEPGWWIVYDQLWKQKGTTKRGTMRIADDADMENFPAMEGCCVYGPIPNPIEHMKGA